MSDRIGQLHGEVMQAGISPSLPNTEGLLWRDSMNAVFAELSIQPALGQTLVLIGNGKRPTDLLTNYTKKVPTLFIGQEDELIAWNEQSGSFKIGSGYAKDGDWMLESWGNHLVGVNGKNLLQYWPATGQAISVQECPYRAELIVRNGPFLVLLNTQVGGEHIAWCDEDNPFEWQTRPDTMAGDLHVRDLDSDIIAAAPMGEDIVFYSRDTVHRLTFRGSPYVFGAYKLAEGIGPVGKHAVCEVSRSHYGFSPKGIFYTNGAEWAFIDKDRIHDWIYDDISSDEDVLAQTVVYNDEVEELVFFFFPGEGSTCNNRCVAYSYRYKSWMPMSIKRQAAVNVSAFPFGVTADVKGNVFFQQTKTLLTNQNLTPLKLPGKGGIAVGFGGAAFGSGSFGGKQGICNANESGIDLPVGDATVLVEDRIAGVIKPVQTLASQGEEIFAETKDLDFGTDRVKRFDGIQAHIGKKHSGDKDATSIDPGEIFLYLGGRNNINEEHTWFGPYDLTECPANCLRFEAVWFRLRIVAKAPKVRWKLSSFDFFGKVLQGKAEKCQQDCQNQKVTETEVDSGVGQSHSLAGSKTTLARISLHELKW